MLEVEQLVAAQDKKRLLAALRSAQRPLMMRECADALGVSRPTAAKLVYACEGAGLVRITPYATTKQVTLTPKGQRWEE